MQHILRAGENHPFPVQLKEFRTFPHFPHAVMNGGQFALKLPAEPIPAGIEQNLSAFTAGQELPGHYIQLYLGNVQPSAVLRCVMYFQFF